MDERLTAPGRLSSEDSWKWFLIFKLALNTSICFHVSLKGMVSFLGGFLQPLRQHITCLEHTHTHTQAVWPSGGRRHRHSSHVQRRMHPPPPPSADIAKVSPALILFDFIHAKVISDSPNGGGDGCRGPASRRAVVEAGKHSVCMCKHARVCACALSFWMR